MDEGLISSEELQLPADAQHIVIPAYLLHLLRAAVGGQPLPEGLLRQLTGAGGWGHLQAGCVLLRGGGGDKSVM